MIKTSAATASQMSARCGIVDRRQRAHDFAPASADQTDEPQDFPAIKGKVDVMEARVS